MNRKPIISTIAAMAAVIVPFVGMAGARMRATSAGLPFLAAAVAATPQTTIDKFSVPIHITQSACPELPGDLTGTADVTLVNRTTVDQNGTTHVGRTLSMHGSGTAGSGTAEARYILIHNDTFHVIVPSESFTFAEKFFLRGQGDAADVQGVLIFHQTILPDGTVVSDVDHERVIGSEGCFPPG